MNMNNKNNIVYTYIHTHVFVTKKLKYNLNITYNK